MQKFKWILLLLLCLCLALLSFLRWRAKEGPGAGAAPHSCGNTRFCPNAKPHRIS